VILNLKQDFRIFVFSEAIDMRAGFGKLQALVTEKMKESLFEGSVFLFLGKNRRLVKLLLFDGTGLVLVAKRMEQNLFMRVEDLFDTREINRDDLQRLLDGANLSVRFAAAQRQKLGRDIA
jgi:transposase